MKKALSIFLLAVCMTASAFADDENRKAMINIITYDDAGGILHSGYGFYLDDQGTALAPYALFENAAKADVIDVKGTKTSVLRILGASSTGDLVKFTTSGKKTAFLQTAAQPSEAGERLLLYYYTNNKKDAPLSGVVEKAEPFNSYVYYSVSFPNEEKYTGCPLVNEAGHVVAIVQKNVEKDAATACAVDARMAGELKISSMSFANSDLRAIGIPKALPATEQEALTYLYMMDQRDSLVALTAYNDFIESYPANADGYVGRANFYAAHDRYDLCDQDFQMAFKQTASADEVHYSLSKAIYQQALAHPQTVYKDWTFGRAAAEAAAAFSEKANPLYLVQEGHSLFAEKKYAEAAAAYEKSCQMYDTLSAGSQAAAPENYFFAARALELAGGDSLRVLALLDSAVARCPKPYTANSAQYLLERAQRRFNAGMFRQAVFDYNDYEKAIGASRLNDKFYYLREQAELNGRMYQQALDDIRSAASINPGEVYYKIEEALVLLQAGVYDEAAVVAQETLRSLPENPDCYKILGIAYGELGKRTQAVEALTKARELGDESADEYLRKYAE